MQARRRKVGAGIAIAAVLALCLAFHLAFNRHGPSEDEMAIRVLLDAREDVGLLVYDYSADGREYSGGTSNANRSPIKHGSETIIAWGREELGSASDTVQFSIRFRIITEYVTPNFENVYPEDLTRYTDTIDFEARFGEEYSVTITGDKTNGYKAALNQ